MDEGEDWSEGGRGRKMECERARGRREREERRECENNVKRMCGREGGRYEGRF